MEFVVEILRTRANILARTIYTLSATPCSEKAVCKTYLVTLQIFSWVMEFTRTFQRCNRKIKEMSGGWLEAGSVLQGCRVLAELCTVWK